MRIISNVLRLSLSLSLLFALAGCAGSRPFDSWVDRPEAVPEPEELLYFIWECTEATSGSYSVHLTLYGSGDLAGTLGDRLYGKGSSLTAIAGQSANIAAEAVHIANSIGCKTAGILEDTVYGWDRARFTGYCIGPRSKLITVMARLLRHAQTFVVTTP